MANHKSAVKRARQNEKRRKRNTSVRSSMKTALKDAITSVSQSKTLVEAAKAVAAGGKALQTAASKGVIPKKRASRLVSRLAARANKLLATAK